MNIHAAARNRICGRHTVMARGKALQNIVAVELNPRREGRMPNETILHAWREFRPNHDRR